MAKPTNNTKETSTKGKNKNENSTGDTMENTNKKSNQTNSGVIYHRGMSTNRYVRKMPLKNMPGSL